MSGDAGATMSFAGNAGTSAGRASGLLSSTVPATVPNAQNEKRRKPTEWNLNL